MSKRCECCGQAMPEYGGIVADDERGEIRFEGRSTVVPPHEYLIFRYLLDKQGRIAAKEQIMDMLYQLRPDADEEPEIKIIDVFVCKLRAKIKPLGLEIGTSWGRGYFIVEPKREVVS